MMKGQKRHHSAFVKGTTQNGTYTETYLAFGLFSLNLYLKQCFLSTKITSQSNPRIKSVNARV